MASASMASSLQLQWLRCTAFVQSSSIATAIVLPCGATSVRHGGRRGGQQPPNVARSDRAA
eukprot:359159-Chlamydomonas_euryale.AAC.28